MLEKGNEVCIGVQSIGQSLLGIFRSERTELFEVVIELARKVFQIKMKQILEHINVKVFRFYPYRTKKSILWSRNAFLNSWYHET